MHAVGTVDVQGRIYIYIRMGRYGLYGIVWSLESKKGVFQYINICARYAIARFKGTVS